MTTKIRWVSLIAANGQPLGYVHPGCARRLTASRQAYTHCKTPYSIRLRETASTSDIEIRKFSESQSEF